MLPGQEYHQPLPENDFWPEDLEEFHGQGEDGNGAGHYSFAFEKPEHALKWWGRDGLQKLYEAGYRVREVPASKVYRSASGKQVFFEHAPSKAKVHRLARGFDHPIKSRRII